MSESVGGLVRHSLLCEVFIYYLLDRTAHVFEKDPAHWDLRFSRRSGGNINVSWDVTPCSLVEITQIYLYYDEV